ncbi:MAG: hypothetical protein AABX89_01425 [Candidatus Thermoplasmatota archaeon]
MPPPLRASEVIFSERADLAKANLGKSKKPEAASILRRLDYLEQRLLADGQEGEVIPLPLPKPARLLEQVHGVLGSLYCCDLPDFWRLLYTIVRADGKPYVYILEVVEHAQYDKWFPNKGR